MYERLSCAVILSKPYVSGNLNVYNNATNQDTLCIALPKGMTTVVDVLLGRNALSVPLLPKANTCFAKDITTIISATENQHLSAALYLLNDDLHRCHEIAQANEGDAEFDLMHSILHRREGDFWNSCWWINRLDSFLLVELYGGSSTSEAKKNAKDFVSRVESWSKHGRDGIQEGELQKIQYHELTLLVKQFNQS